MAQGLIGVPADRRDGGFGSKLGISPEAVAAALAAKQLKRPVAVAMSLQNVFEMTTRRSETNQRIRLAADAGGRLTGFGHEVLVSNLPGEKFSGPVTQATPFLYCGENRVIGHRWPEYIGLAQAPSALPERRWASASVQTGFGNA